MMSVTCRTVEILSENAVETDSPSVYLWLHHNGMSRPKVTVNVEE